MGVLDELMLRVRQSLGLSDACWQFEVAQTDRHRGGRAKGGSTLRESVAGVHDGVSCDCCDAV